MGVDREKRFASDLDDEKRREQERKALRLLAQLEQHEDEPGKATLVGFDQMSGLVGGDPARPRVEEAFSALPWSRPSHATFDDFRATGLREVLAHLSDRTLRKATLAAADREIAKRVAATRPAPAASTAGAAMWRAAERRAATLYRHAQDNGEVASDDPVVDEALARCGSGQPLAASVRAQMERELGISLARVRVHTDSIAAAAAKAVRAHAFTVGEDIFFADGTYAPDSREGRKLLAHELTHVAQAHEGRTSTGGSGIRVSEPGEALEREADAVAERVMQAPRAPKRSASMRAASPKARYTRAPSHASSLLLRKAAGKKAPITDDTPFKEVGELRNKTTWRLGDDDVFVCVSGPDGKPLETTITVSAQRNADRWNALGKRWAAAAPGRTWPRPAEGRSKAPTPSSARTDSTPTPADPHSGADTDSAGTPVGYPTDLGSAFEAIRSVVPIPNEWVAIPAAGTGRAYLDIHLIDKRATISAPTLNLNGFYAGPLYTGKATFAGLVLKVNTTEASATFSTATLERALIIADGKDIVIGKITLLGGKLGAANGGTFGAGIHFDEARITGIRYPGAPPTDLVLTNSTLLAFAQSFNALTAKTPGEAPGTLPTLPKSQLLAGTRVNARLDGLGGSYSAGPRGNTMGGFTHFEAQLLKDGTSTPTEPLASITIDGASVYRNASRLEGGIKRVHVTGSADFVLALLDSPTVRAQKDVADVIDQLTKVGIVPTAGTQLTLENVQLGASGSTASVRTDIVLDFDVPGSLKLHLELRGVAMSGDPTAQTGHVDFGKVFLVLSDGKGPIAALMAEGTADKGDKQLAGAIRHLEGSGDVSRITTALRSVKLPPKVDAVLAAVKKHVSTQGALDIDVEIETGAGGKSELRGNAHARLEVDGVGSVDLSVVNFHGDGDTKKKDISGSLAFERFEAHLTPKASANRKATGDAAALIITGAHAATASGSLPLHASADLIEIRGDLGKSAKMVTEIHKKVASLPPMLQQAVKLVRTLDLGVVSPKAATSTPAPSSEPLPKTSVATNAHVALAIPRVGTIDAAVRGFVGSTSEGAVDGNFETFEVSLLTTAGKRAARIVIRGGSGAFEPATKNDSAVFQAQLHDVVLEGNSRGLLQALENHSGLLASAPASIRTGIEYLRAHQISLASTANARATDLAVYRSDDTVDVTTGTITARIAIPGGVATATLTKAEANPEVAGFDLLEVRVNDNAAILRIDHGQWTAADATGTARSITISGDGPKLHAILEPRIMALLPAEIGTAIRKYSAAIVSATASDVSVRLTDDGAVAKLPVLDLNGSITFTDDGTKYTCKHASIHVYGAQVDGSADAQTITADGARIEGRFESVGGRTIRGNLIVTTGAAKLTHGAAGSGLVAKDLRARGWLDVGAGKKPVQESDHELRDFDDTVATATKNAPALRSLQLDFHAPLTPGTYGTKLGLFGKAQRVRVSPGAALDLHVGVDNGSVTTLLAKITGDVSVAFGNKIHRLGFEDQKLDADITGWLGPLADAIVGLGDATKYSVKFDVTAFVTYLAGQYRPFIVDDVKDKGGANWADEDRLERDARQADLEKRKAEWDADSKHEAVDEPKTYGAVMKDLMNLHAVTGTLDARIARPEAVGRSGADALSGDAQIHGSFVGGNVRLDADATVDTGNGTAKAKGVSSGDVSVSDTSTGGTMVTFGSFHVEQLSWDPAASAKTKPPPK